MDGPMERTIARPWRLDPLPRHMGDVPPKKLEIVDT